MKTIKIIDLLNKIANGEIDYTTKFDAKVNMGYCGINEYFERYPINENYLNCEIELEDTPKEDKKIEKIEHFKTRAGTIAKLRFDLETINNRFENKINEIIDKLNGEDNE